MIGFFDGMMHCNMKQIAIYSGHFWPIIAPSVEIFHDRLGPGLRDEVTSVIH